MITHTVYEVVHGDRAIWQSENALTYQCPACGRAVFSQNEIKDARVVIVCKGLEHLLTITFTQG